MVISGSSLILAGLSSFNLDALACQEYLCTGVIYEDRTFYEEIKKLPPSSVLSYREGELKAASQYWQISNLVPDSLEGDQAITIVSQNLLRVVKTLNKSFLKPVCDLTGGYDSRAVVSTFLKSGGDFCTTVSGDPRSGDVLVSKEISERFGFSHWHVPRSQNRPFQEIQKFLYLTDGEYDVLEYDKTFQVHRLLMDRYDVSVNGSFGEVARGYWWELLFPTPGKRGKIRWKTDRSKTVCGSAL